MSKCAQLLYRAIRELDYIHEIHGTEYDSSVPSAEGKAIVREGMELLGMKDLSTEPEQMTLAERYGTIEVK